MFAFIKGYLVEATVLQVVIENQGVGYQVFIPASVFSKLPQIGEPILLYTSFIVRELSQTLYGFLSRQERDLFDAFLGVTGVGPKLALSIIGHLSLTDLQQAIAKHDLTTLSKVPGIGKKTAERLIIELRDKVATFSSIDQSDSPTSTPINAQTQQISDAMCALINLGYNQQTAQKAIKKTLSEAPEGIQLGELITLALQRV